MTATAQTMHGPSKLLSALLLTAALLGVRAHVDATVAADAAPPAAPAHVVAPARKRKVLLIGVDGLRPDVMLFHPCLLYTSPSPRDS